MNLRPHLYISFLMIFLCCNSIAQNLQIGDGNKTRTFKTGNLIMVAVPVEEGRISEACPTKFFVGRLIAYKNEMVSLRVRHEQECITVEGKTIGTESENYYEKEEEAWPTIDIPASTIVSITKQGTKKWKSINDGDLAGAILFTFGAFELAAAGLADNEENQDALIVAGATTSALGLIMIAVFNRKTYYINNSHIVETKHKTWNIL